MSARSRIAADLHLDPDRPEVIELARAFFDDCSCCERLYLIGDLFEYWLGDDHVDPRLSPIIGSLAALADTGTRIHLMHGNRDFLIGREFVLGIPAFLIPHDEHVLTLHGHRMVLMHGDTLCTDDVDYQSLRRQLRDSEWKREFLARSIDERLAEAAALRERSREAIADKQGHIMDVNDEAVLSCFREHDHAILVHGHTHRPEEHRIEVDGHRCRRLVVGDWHADHAIYAEVDENDVLLRRFDASDRSPV